MGSAARAEPAYGCAGAACTLARCGCSVDGRIRIRASRHRIPAKVEKKHTVKHGAQLMPPRAGADMSCTAAASPLGHSQNSARHKDKEGENDAAENPLGEDNSRLCTQSPQRQAAWNDLGQARGGAGVSTADSREVVDGGGSSHPRHFRVQETRHFAAHRPPAAARGVMRARVSARRTEANRGRVLGQQPGAVQRAHPARRRQKHTPAKARQALAHPH